MAAHARTDREIAARHRYELLRAFAIGATAVGALAIGAVAIGRLAIRNLRIGDAWIDRLTVNELVADMR